jgi:hypothetical protein
LEIDVVYGFQAYAGALSGRAYGTKYKNDAEALKKINDFDWLKARFDEGKH